jgi:hypothetical protein
LAIYSINWNQNFRRKEKIFRREKITKHNSEISQRKIFNKKTSQTLTFFSNHREQIHSKPSLQSTTSQTKSNIN